jgi:hypothetical protein
MQLAELFPPPTPVNSIGAGGTIILPWLVHVWGYLPTAVAVIGGVLGIVWYTIMIWESQTGRDWRNRLMTKRKMRKIGRLQAKVKLYQAELDALDVKRQAEHTATQKVESAKVEAAKIASATEQSISQMK